MGGSLRLAPRTDTGAAFCLRLPVLEENPEATEEQPALFAPDPELRVLLVDDEPDVLDVVRELLAPMRVVAVQSAQAAREAWEQDFDLILSDIVMPAESGLELRQWVAEHHPSALPRFVLMTGSAVGLEDELARLGSDQPVLAKPLKKDRILDLLARVSRTSDH
jgi:CheY-like chemotaxis protein